MTQVNKLKQAVAMIRCAMNVYDKVIEEMSEKTGKEYITEHANAHVSTEALEAHFALLIGECVLNDIPEAEDKENSL